MAFAGPSTAARPSSSSTSSPLCLSCFSCIPPKTASRAHITPCCGRPICINCLAANPRLRDYVPCLSCGDGVQASRARRRARYPGGRGGGDALGGTAPDSQFALGGDSDDEQDMQPAARPAESPPPYDAVGGAEERRSIRSDRSAQASEGERLPDGSVASDQQAVQIANVPVNDEDDEESDEEPSIEPIQHMVMRGDTVRGLATRYGLDPYEILKINSLPFEALQANPQLVQTRKFLYLSRPTARNGPGDVQVAGAPKGALEEDEARQQQRKLKRFQLVTKEADTSVARAYLALEELEGASGSKPEVLFSLDDEDGPFAEKKAASGSANLEARAVNRFFDDNQWEQAQQAAGPSSAAGPPRRGNEKRAVDSPVKSGSLLQGAPWLTT